MNLGELLSEVRSQLDDVIDDYDDSDALWKDAELIRYINEAQREVAIRAECLFDSSTSSVSEIAIQKDVDNYPISNLILHIKSVFLDSDNCVLSRVDACDILWSCKDKRQGVPRKYTLDKEVGKIYFDSIPQEVDTARLIVSRLPLDDLASDSDVPEIHAKYHFKMLEWVKYLAYGKHDSEMYDPNSRELAMRNFFEYFGSSTDAQEQKRQLYGGEIGWMMPQWGDNSYENRSIW